jgi:hypothetical protein
MAQMLQLQQVLLVVLKQTAQLAPCARVMMVLKNVKRANKRFADWLEIEEFRRKLC